MRLLHLFCLLLILCCSVPALAAADNYQVVTF